VSKASTKILREMETHATEIVCVPCAESYMFPGKRSGNYRCRKCGAAMRVTVARVSQEAEVLKADD
jgi:tRNA(Ile2) C34 agmatinyltransferase TiaS